MRYPDGKVFRDTKCSCHPVARSVNYHASTYASTAHRACCEPCQKGKQCKNTPNLETNKAKKINKIFSISYKYNEQPLIDQSDKEKPYFPLTNSIYQYYTPRIFIIPPEEKDFKPEPLGYFLEDEQGKFSDVKISAQYGKAVGSFGSGTPGGTGCSAWLSGGPYAITAAHGACGNPYTMGVTVQSPYEKSITLGMYGSNWNASFLNHYQKGQEDALNRLVDLGFSINNLSIDGKKLLPLTLNKNGVSPQLQVYSCDFKDISLNPLLHEAPPISKEKSNLTETLWHRFGQKSGHRDVSYWYTRPKILNFKLVSNREEKVFILPSHLYGHLYMTTFEKPSFSSLPSYSTQEGYISRDLPSNWSRELLKDVSLIASNIFDHHNTTNVFTYISPRSKTPGRNNQPYLFEGRLTSNHTAGLGLDYKGLFSIGGSSGGAILTASNNRVIGINHGGTFPPSRNQIPFQPDSYKNIISLLPPEAMLYTHQSPAWSIERAKKMLKPTSFSNKVGGWKGSKNHHFSCPTGFAVAGIVGSGVKGGNSQGKDRVGHTGIVCLPFPSENDHFLLNSYTIGFSKALVFAGTSIDTAVEDYSKKIYLSSVPGIEFNQYTNEYLTTGRPRPVMQYLNAQNNLAIRRVAHPPQFSMCAPGYFLSKLYISTNTFERNLSLIESIFGMTCQHWEGKDSYFKMFRKFIGSPNPTNLTILQGQPNSIATGISISSGWYTDGIQIDFSNI